MLNVIMSLIKPLTKIAIRKFINKKIPSKDGKAKKDV